VTTVAQLSQQAAMARRRGHPLYMGDRALAAERARIAAERRAERERKAAERVARGLQMVAAVRSEISHSTAPSNPPRADGFRLSCDVELATIRALHKASLKRQTTVDVIAARILNTLASDGLIDALLDDGVGEGE
jgi:hypothetical protein